METMDAILTRRSIRKYTNQSIPDKLLKEIIEAAMSAPSAKNEQPWHFIIIRDKVLFNKIMEFHPYAEMLKEAPLAILVCSDVTLAFNKEYAVIDSCAATQNLLLAAHAKGLGAVWLGIYPREERITGMKKLLSLPEDILPISLIPMGYPAEQKPRENRYNQSRIHYDKW